MSETATVHAVLHGRVQGVGFRWFTRDIGERAGVSGWVHNRPDGTVEVEATGERDRVESFLARVAEGPTMSRVDRVDATWLDDVKEHRGFSIR